MKNSIEKKIGIYLSESLFESNYSAIMHMGEILDMTITDYKRDGNKVTIKYKGLGYTPETIEVKHTLDDLDVYWKKVVVGKDTVEIWLEDE